MEKYNGKREHGMDYRPTLETAEMDLLFASILALKSREDCYRFFEDICTISELKALSQRIAVARMLDDNVTYHEISECTGASTATISRVNRCLTYGSGGYRIVLDQLKDATSQ